MNDPRLARKFETLRSTTSKQLKAQERTVTNVAKTVAMAVLADRNKSWLEMLNRLDHLERKVESLEATCRALVRSSRNK